MIIDNYELRTGYQPRRQHESNGRFAKGSVPFNKGRKWSEWMREDMQAKVKAIGVKNLTHRAKKGDAGTCHKPVIAIDPEGRMSRHIDIKSASEHFHIGRENIGRCCRYNRKGLEPTGTWKRINTNHKYMGIRFYYEDDVHIWSNARRKSV